MRLLKCKSNLQQALLEGANALLELEPPKARVGEHPVMAFSYRANPRQRLARAT